MNADLPAPVPAFAPAPPTAGRRWAAWFDDRLNAILVKDLRQWAKGKLFVGGYFLLILASALAAGLYAAGARAEGRSGAGLFTVVFTVALVACGHIVPYFVYDRYRAERESGAEELIRLSTLTPVRVLRGKLFSAWCASLLAVCALAPAWTTAYLLGGIDLERTMLHGAALAAAAMAMPCLYLYCAALGGGLMARIAAIALLVGGVILAIAQGPALSELLVRRAAGDGVDAWFGLGVAVAAGATAARFLYDLAAHRLRGFNEYRDRRPRLSLLAFALVTAALAGWIGWLLAGEGRGVGGQLLGEASSRPAAWRNAAAAATVGWSWAFGAGFALLGLSDTLDRRPARLRTAKRSWPRRDAGFFFAPGVGRLCAFYLLGLAAAALGAAAYVAMERAWRVGADGVPDAGTSVEMLMALAPFFATAPGLAIHAFGVRPMLARKRRRAAPTIAIFGALALMSAFGVVALILIDARVVDAGLRPFLYAFSPLTWSSLKADDRWVAAMVGGLATGVSALGLAACAFQRDAGE